MSMAATAAFIYVAGQLGVSGFQAGCADMDFLRRSRDLKGPFAIINAENMLYPQYDIIEKVKGWLADWQEWAGKEAAKRMAKNDQAMIHPDVWARWAELKKREILFRNFNDVLNPEA